MSPPASNFPISNSRILPLPSPLITHYTGSPLPGITASQQYHGNGTELTSSHNNPHHYYFPQSHGTATDSYFPTAPDSRRSTRADSKPNISSISSILSTATVIDTQSDTSSTSSSPMYNFNCYWATSPTSSSATTPRTSSLASTPLSGYGPGSVEYADPSYTTRDFPELKEEDGAKRKIRSNTKEVVNKGDEYDVLGRKKPKTPRTPMSWDPEDDILLKQLKEEQRLGWKEIATHFPGRTSHACQFRWRRLVSGTLKYYQGHRRPPVVTTTSSSFASEMAATGSSHVVSAPATPSVPRYPAPLSPVSPPQHAQHYGYDRNSYHNHRASFSSGSFSLPSPASSSPQQHMGSPMGMPGTPPPPQTPTFHSALNYGSYGQITPFFSSDDDEVDWSPEEDALLMDRKLCFEEVNVLLSRRREPEIWRRMGKLRLGRGRSESSASGDSDICAFQAVDVRGTIKLPPVPAGRVLRSQSIQR